MGMSLKESEYVKIRTSVPLDKVDSVRQAMIKAGAGKQGNYISCSFSYKGFGSFTPLPGANPAIGAVGKEEKVEEEVIEILCHKDLVAKVVRLLKSAHPYEEPAIDIISRLEVE